MGLIEPGVKPHDQVNIFGLKSLEWEEMSEEEKRQSSRAMETYAAMVEIVDEQIGRVVRQLEEDGELDNTVGSRR